MSNEFIITIKENGNATPMTIADTDTFTATLLVAKDGSVVSTIPVTVYDAVNGQILLTISDSLANSLNTEKGPKADNYYSKPLYRLAIDCDTAENGKFVAKLAKVYVE